MHAGTHTVAHIASRAHGLRLALICSRCAGRTSSASGIAQASFKHSYLWVHACMHGRASVVICTVWCVWICGARLDGRMREGGRACSACSACERRACARVKPLSVMRELVHFCRIFARCGDLGPRSKCGEDDLRKLVWTEPLSATHLKSPAWPGQDAPAPGAHMTERRKQS